MDLTPLWQFLSPYVNTSAVAVIGAIVALVVSALKLLKVDLGKFQWAVGWVIAAGYYFIQPSPGIPWWQVALTIIATGLVATGVFSTIKNTLQAKK